MKKDIEEILKKIVKAPFHLAGLDVIRKESVKAKIKCSMPSWEERMTHANRLGFSPKTIFDCGAFQGEWTRSASRIFPGSQIVAIEPNPFLQETLRHRISGVQPSPILFKAALGESPGKSTLNIWGEKSSDAGASLYEHVSGNAAVRVEVQIDTLDNIAEKTGLLPDLIKLDLQGGELAALKGGGKTLRHAEFAMIEFGCLDAYIDRTTPCDLAKIMYENDFCLYDIVDCHYRPYDNALTGGDFFFVKNSSILRSHKGWA